MANTSSLDASKLSERLHGLGQEEFWLHLEAASMLEKYPAKDHARRVRDKLDVSKGLIYLPGQAARNNEDSDMPAKFRQRRYFYYMSGCNEADCHLTYDIQHDRLALFIPRINPARVIWNGRGSTPAEAADIYDIDEVYFADDLEAWITDWHAHYQGSIFVLHEYQSRAISSFKDEIDSSSLEPAMNLARIIKDDHEIKLIRKANDISSEAHKRVLANIASFKNEAQVEGLFIDVCISRQAKQQAYDPIAASGPNAGTLHYEANNEDFEDRQLMCLDAGCEFELYASDITRTFPLSGSWPSVESMNVYKLVQRMQETCIRRLAPGVRYLDLHILAHHIAIEGLLKLGILHNGTIEEIYKAGTSKAFFPHGLGHHIGLEVHDVGQKELMSFNERNSKHEKAPSLYPEDYHLPAYDEKLCLAPTDPHSPHLEEGMVVTVEPGIYFSAYALSYFYLPSPIHSKYINKEALYRYFPVGGVRIEDDILITRKGHENLTTAPKGQEMLEIIRTGNANWPLVSGSGCRPSGAESKYTEGEPLMRAPGISEQPSDLRIKPVVRASTLPVNLRAVSADLPRDSNSPHVSALDDLPYHPSDPHERPRSLKSICGNPTNCSNHLYMRWQLDPQDDSTLSHNASIEPKPKCTHCAVIMQSPVRLSPLQTANSSHNARLAGPYPAQYLIKTLPVEPRKGFGIEQPDQRYQNQDVHNTAPPRLARQLGVRTKQPFSGPLSEGDRTPQVSVRTIAAHPSPKIPQMCQHTKYGDHLASRVIHAETMSSTDMSTSCNYQRISPPPFTQLRPTEAEPMLRAQPFFLDNATGTAPPFAVPDNHPIVATRQDVWATIARPPRSAAVAQATPSVPKHRKSLVRTRLTPTLTSHQPSALEAQLLDEMRGLRAAFDKLLMEKGGSGKL